MEKINKKKQEILKALNDLLLDENYISVIDILDDCFETIKDKCISMALNKECPDDLKSPLYNLLYASTKLNIEELKTFKNKITYNYGSDYLNKDDLVNKDLIEKLNTTSFPNEVMKERINDLIEESNESMSFDLSNNDIKNNKNEQIVNILTMPTLKDDSILVSKTKEGSKPNNEVCELFRQETYKTVIRTENEGNQQPQENKNKEKDLFGGEIVETVYYSENKNQQPKDVKNNDIDLAGIEIGQTMPLEFANPDNKVNPFEGNINDIIDPIPKNDGKNN